MAMCLPIKPPPRGSPTYPMHHIKSESSHDWIDAGIGVKEESSSDVLASAPKYTADGSPKSRESTHTDTIGILQPRGALSTNPKTASELETHEVSTQPEAALNDSVEEYVLGEIKRPHDDEVKHEPASDETSSPFAQDEKAPILPAPKTIGLEDRDVPSDPNQISTFEYDPKFSTLDRLVATYVARLSRPEELSTQNRQATFDILKSFSKLMDINSTIEKALNIKWILSSILGECPMKYNPRPYSFPEPFPRAATMIMELVQQKLGFEEDAPEEPVLPPPVEPPESKKTRKRKRSPTSPALSTKRQNMDPGAPEYGGMLHNLAVTASGFRIKDPSQAVSCHQWGANGLQVGQWWPFQHCAIRDGAHGASNGGIAGGEYDGAKSIIVGGSKYEGMDKDLGDTIYYSGSNSHANTNPNTPILSSSTKALMRSYTDRRKIRVIRKAGGSSKYAPSAGLRYDGLYKVTDTEDIRNAVGGAYRRFILHRCDGQAEIDTSRPTRAEKGYLERWKQSI